MKLENFVNRVKNVAPHSPTLRVLAAGRAWVAERVRRVVAAWRQMVGDSSPTASAPVVFQIEVDDPLRRELEAAREEARTWEMLALDVEERLNAAHEVHAEQVSELTAENESLKERLRALEYELELAQLNGNKGKVNGRPKLPRVVIVGGNPHRKQTIDLFSHRIEPVWFPSEDGKGYNQLDAVARAMARADAAVIVNDYIGHGKQDNAIVAARTCNVRFQRIKTLSCVSLRQALDELINAPHCGTLSSVA